MAISSNNELVDANQDGKLLCEEILLMLERRKELSIQVSDEQISMRKKWSEFHDTCCNAFCMGAAGERLAVGKVFETIDSIDEERIKTEKTENELMEVSTRLKDLTIKHCTLLGKVFGIKDIEKAFRKKKK